MPGTRLLLVRHGESTWNAQSRWQGQADPPLSPFGERQAEDATVRLAEIATVTAVWVSDLVRARRTGELMAQRLGLGGVRKEPRLRERDVGSWSGLTRDEIERQWPGYLAARRSPPDFESDDALLERTRAGLAAAIDGSDAGDVLVVTHGGVIRTIERSLGATPERLPNLGGRWLLADPPTDLALGERVVLLEPEEVTVPRGPSEQDPVRSEDESQ
ncbi:MAG TPA: histidine phosphatase family protein [Acidimicrobiia bacterium]|nr:histidine phosphatase family protein [Acidimicrobiia bacterium]